MSRVQLSVIIAAAIFAVCCTDGNGAGASVAGDEADPYKAGAKADDLQMDDLSRAERFFVTQVFDERWNPDGLAEDTESNNCGPASFAMVLGERELLPVGLSAEQAIDHARALMYPGFPDIDPAALPEGASVFEEGGLLFVDDDTHPVYFDMMEDEPSVPRAVQHVGWELSFGHSFAELDGFLEASGAAIAHGHITSSWRARFPGEYGDCNPGAVPHFIAVFAASEPGEYLVCDPMHRGGAVRMTRSQLSAFFKSPVSVYDTSIKLIGWTVPDPVQAGID